MYSGSQRPAVLGVERFRSTWDITKLVKKWYNGAANNGIVVKAVDETAAARNVYYASNYPGGEVAYPTLNIYFVNNAGLEDYWSYHSQSAGRAGTGSVNDYTGNMQKGYCS